MQFIRITKSNTRTDWKKDIILSIISEDNLHISSYLINQERLDKLEAQDWWVLQKRNIK